MDQSIHASGIVAPVIRPLGNAAEAEFCARFMAASEPWRTLGITAEPLFQKLTDPAREVHVATVDDQIVGVLILQLAGPLNGYLQTIATHPGWRGRGLGTRLMQFAEARIFRQSPNVFLCVSDFNHRAQAFYKRLGYQRVGELTDFLAPGRSEILMRKTNGPLLGFLPQK
jgi:[ribosomal protein S18]-alanine N-acetyltransferase